MRRSGVTVLNQVRRYARLSNGVVEVTNPVNKETSTISGRWLRDNCSCSSCRNASTSQRQINVFKDKRIGIVTSVETSPSHLRATFDDGHQSLFQWTSLFDRRSDTTERLRSGHQAPSTWTASVAENPPTAQFGKDIGHLLRLIKQYGFAFIDGMPATPGATEDLINQIGPIRNTHYGAFYDFTSDLSSKDTAYTAEALEPHTDTTYFTEPIGIQALHLLSHTDGSGGLSSLVDGFNAAFQLREQHPEHYGTLSKIGVYAHASGNEGISIQPALPQPVLSHYPVDHPLAGQLMQVRWNNADRAGIAADFAETERWYEAAEKFDELLSSQQNQYWFQLVPGKCLFFDNWRALHGRSEFTGKRRMCGGYVNRDDFISKLRMSTLSAADIAASTVTG